jgi:hypothetical protein
VCVASSCPLLCARRAVPHSLVILFRAQQAENLQQAAGTRGVRPALGEAGTAQGPAAAQLRMRSPRRRRPTSVGVARLGGDDGLLVSGVPHTGQDCVVDGKAGKAWGD